MTAKPKTEAEGLELAKLASYLQAHFQPLYPLKTQFDELIQHAKSAEHKTALDELFGHTFMSKAAGARYYLSTSDWDASAQEKIRTAHNLLKYPAADTPRLVALCQAAFEGKPDVYNQAVQLINRAAALYRQADEHFSNYQIGTPPTGLYYTPYVPEMLQGLTPSTPTLAVDPNQTRVVPAPMATSESAIPGEQRPGGTPPRSIEGQPTPATRLPPPTRR